MNIYFSGIGGNGIGPLAEIAKQAGYHVSGSDLSSSSMTNELEQKGIKIYIGQTGTEIAKAFQEKPIDWLVISSAIPNDHPEVTFAKRNNIKISKRGELLNYIIKNSNQKLIAIAGTHGKTTTTAMLVWTLQKLGYDPSYSIGSTISFGPSGYFNLKSELFVYEADEHDKNMLDFKPQLTLIPSLDYDHSNTYPTVEDYKRSFIQFCEQSERVITWQEVMEYLNLDQEDLKKFNVVDLFSSFMSDIKLSGKHNRMNGLLTALAITEIYEKENFDEITKALSAFPGAHRRFEKLSNNIYTDYAHHPKEIEAILQMAREINPHVIAVYQPHQNIRQHEIADKYDDCFSYAEKIFWLPTFLTREDTNLNIITPKELIAKIKDPSKAEPVELNDKLKQRIKHLASEGKLILFMGAGSIDKWARDNFFDN